MSRPKVRDDVAMMEGYHSPQLDVSIRLNTNEAPQPPPPEFTRRLTEAIGSIEWHRYPSRSAHNQLRAASQIAAARSLLDVRGAAEEVVRRVFSG